MKPSSVFPLVGAKTLEGENNYYGEVIRQRSAYIYAGAVVAEESADRTLLCLLTLLVLLLLTVLTPSTLKLSLTSHRWCRQPGSHLGELQAAYNKLTLENVALLDYIPQGPGMANLDDPSPRPTS